MHDVVVHILRCNHQIADQLCILRDAVGWNGAMQRIFHRAHRGDTVHQCAHTANALRKGPGVTRVTSAQDDFDTAHHGAGGIGVDDLAAGICFRLDAQVTLDTGDGVDDNALG